TLAVLLSSRPYALSHANASLARSTAEGHRLAVWLLLLSGSAAVLVLALDLAQRRVAVPPQVRVACGAALLALVVVVLAAFVVREGGPLAMTRHAWRAFEKPQVDTGTDLGKRLFTFSG